MKKWKNRIAFLCAGGSILLSAAGCTRSQMNYQISESIGTLGQYENNEPVETPQMKRQREQDEINGEEAAALDEILAQAESLAAGYNYDEAIACLQNADINQYDEQVQAAIASYQQAPNDFEVYEDSVAHLSFSNLIADPSMAFDGDGLDSTYSSIMITKSEFEGILKELYENGYMLIDLHDLVEKVTEESGETHLEKKKLQLPADKKPIIFSIENLNYSQVRDGDGIAVRLTKDEEDQIKAVYTDADGKEQTGDYDIIPVLEAFIQDHPDFSFQGARGIIGLSACEGAFGYSLDTESDAYEENQAIIQQIASTLAADGWVFAGEGYQYCKMDQFTTEELKDDLQKWQDTLGSLLPEVDILFYPYGAEVSYTEENLEILQEQGYRFYVSLYANDEYLEVNDTYVRQTRRTVNGYVFETSPTLFKAFFQTTQILDSAR